MLLWGLLFIHYLFIIIQTIKREFDKTYFIRHKTQSYVRGTHALFVSTTKPSPCEARWLAISEDPTLFMQSLHALEPYLKITHGHTEHSHMNDAEVCVKNSPLLNREDVSYSVSWSDLMLNISEIMVKMPCC